MKWFIWLIAICGATVALAISGGYQVARADQQCVQVQLCVTTSPFYHVTCKYDAYFNCIGPDPADPQPDWGQAGTMVDVTWFLPNSCAILNTRGWQEIAGVWTKVEVGIENSPTDANHIAALPYCAKIGSGQDVNIHSSWANAGNPYWSVPDACIVTPANCYAVTRIRIYSYATGTVYERYASNDGLHSTPVCWQVGCP